MMSEKEIWYVWSGRGEKPSGVTGVFYADGDLLDSKEMDLSWLSSYTYESEWNYIVAYTLGETRERVECVDCFEGLFYYDDVKEVKCHVCDGRGYRWKMGKSK